MLYLIGLGLNDEKDISIKGLEAVKKCDIVYLENYTSKLNCRIEDLEKLYSKKILPADRDLVENRAEELILRKAREKNVALLVIGDVFSATTHIDLMLRAKEKGIKTEIIHNASILTAVGMTGLELYKFGKVTSIPFHNEDVRSPLDVLEMNLNNDLHTLFLLDLDLKTNKLMTINDALAYLMNNGFGSDELCVGCAALGSEEPVIKAVAAEELIKFDFKKFPQCLIVPSRNRHFMEDNALKMWK